MLLEPTAVLLGPLKGRESRENQNQDCTGQTVRPCDTRMRGFQKILYSVTFLFKWTNKINTKYLLWYNSLCNNTMKMNSSCSMNRTLLYSIFADQDLLVLNKADLLCAWCEGLKVSGEGPRLSEGLAT